MKIFMATPEAKVLSQCKCRDYEFENILESYYYIEGNIDKKYNEVIEYNKNKRKKGDNTM